MVTALLLSACLCVSGTTEAREMAQRRPSPRKPPRVTLADSLAAGLPAPPQATVKYGPVTPEESQQLLSGDLNVGGYSFGKTGQIRLPQRDRFSLAHELFHALDAQVFTDSDRARFQRILRAPAGEWKAATGAAGGKQSPSEIAADYFAAIATKQGPTEGQGTYVDAFGPKRLKRFGRSLGRLRDRRGLDLLDLGGY